MSEAHHRLVLTRTLPATAAAEQDGEEDPRHAEDGPGGPGEDSLDHRVPQLGQEVALDAGLGSIEFPVNNAQVSDGELFSGFVK